MRHSGKTNSETDPQILAKWRKTGRSTAEAVKAGMYTSILCTCHQVSINFLSSLRL